MKYDSKFEEKLHKTVLAGANYHPKKIEYRWPSEMKKYEPDFIQGDYVIETKGRFRAGEAKKYRFIQIAVRQMGKKFIFCFQKPSVPMPGAKTRKDGTMLTHGEWASKNGFEWCDPTTIGDVL